jgi:hypothetical protein
MDPPQTRREKKKTPKEKKASVFSSKHIRQMEAKLSAGRGSCAFGAGFPQK